MHFQTNSGLKACTCWQLSQVLSKDLFWKSVRCLSDDWGKLNSKFCLRRLWTVVQLRRRSRGESSLLLIRLLLTLWSEYFHQSYLHRWHPANHMAHRKSPLTSWFGLQAILSHSSGLRPAKKMLWLCRYQALSPFDSRRQQCAVCHPDSSSRNLSCSFDLAQRLICLPRSSSASQCISLAGTSFAVRALPLARLKFRALG